MKGIYLQSGIEYRIETAADQILQGDAFTCLVTVKNHSGSTAQISPLTLTLALGVAKKVKAKEPNAFVTVQEWKLAAPGELSPGAAATDEVAITLDQNAPVTDKSQGLYLVLSAGDLHIGSAPLTVLPHPHIASVVSTLETVFQFMAKATSSKGRQTIVKLKPPEARHLTLVDELNVAFERDGNDIAVDYRFSVKKFEPGAVKLDVKKGKAELSQRWSENDLLFGGGFVNQEFVENALKEALAHVSTGL